MSLYKKLYSVNEALECNGGFLPMSKSAVYKLIQEGIIPSIRLGKRVFIPGSFLEKLLKENREEQENHNIGA